MPAGETSRGSCFACFVSVFFSIETQGWNASRETQVAPSRLISLSKSVMLAASSTQGFGLCCTAFFGIHKGSAIPLGVTIPVVAIPETSPYQRPIRDTSNASGGCLTRDDRVGANRRAARSFVGCQAGCSSVWSLRNPRGFGTSGSLLFDPRTSWENRRSLSTNRNTLGIGPAQRCHGCLRFNTESEFSSSLIMTYKQRLYLEGGHFPN